MEILSLRRVIVESPYRGTPGEVALNVAYARECLRHSLAKGEAPIASHLLHTQVLDDEIPGDRALGIAAGIAWIPIADCLAVYTDRGITTGMAYAIVDAARSGICIEFREIK